MLFRMTVIQKVQTLCEILEVFSKEAIAKLKATRAVSYPDYFVPMNCLAI